MARLPLTFMLTSVVLAMACNPEDPNFGQMPGGESDTDTDTDTDADTDSDTDTDTDADTDSDTDTDATFDNPGDIATYVDEDGDAEVDLSDLSGDSNQDQDYFLVLVNPNESSMSYDLRYTQGDGVPDAGDTGAGDAGTEGPPAPLAESTKGPSPFRQRLREARKAGRIGSDAPAPAPSNLQVGVSRQEFRVRNSLVDDSSFEVRDATLWAVGDKVAIWVDEDVPIDWDYDCDGVIDEEHPYENYGFDNCDLSTIADIVDVNIVPNLESWFGSVSDVNGDGLVSVVITPTLNAMSTSSEDEDEWGNLVGSYADPEVDLNEWDSEDNPQSDYQEVVFVFAPDPYGFYNPFQTATVDSYTSVGLLAEIARAFVFLISYNQHVLVNGSEEVEETWMLEGLGALAADITGFGAHYYDEAWDYLDAPHLHPLVNADDSDVLNAQSWGAQYLFLRWLADRLGDDATADQIVLVNALVGTTNTGVDNVSAVTGEDFTDLVVDWQVAMLTTGQTKADGSELVDPTLYPPFLDATTIDSPPSDTTPGALYGAHGYQRGFNVNGLNQVYEGGTTTTPLESQGERVLAGNTDHFTHVTGFEFEGWLEGNYAAQVVRLTDLPFDASAVQIQSSSSGYQGVVVRWEDAAYDDLAIEDIFSSTDANSIAVPELTEDGPVYGVGEITTSAYTQVIDAEGETENKEVYDTDRWLIDLSDRANGEQVQVAIWLDRHFDGGSGSSAPEDPWLAVVNAEDVPTPTVGTISSDSCPDGETFGFPSSVLEYLYYQQFLSGTVYEEDDSFDPCGEQSEEELTCEDDWDEDGVANSDEPQPGNFFQQVAVHMCQQHGEDGYTPYDSDAVDADSVDEDDSTTVDRTQNLGSVSGEDGEEAYLLAELEGGNQYLVVVGGGTDTGVYELTFQLLD